MIIETAFDFRVDSGGKDPDSHSKTLKQYHKILWSKQLPSGDTFCLKENDANRHLVFNSVNGDQYLSSDSIANSFRHRRGKIASVINQIEPNLIDEFYALNYTMGAFILFPGNRIDGQATINAQRGFNYYIADRFDLTLECIRRHYLHKESPLSAVLLRYDSFFRLFRDFKSYVEFFLLDDLVNADYSEVLFFTPAESLFESSPLPLDVPSYLAYRESSMKFVRARNQRISNWVEGKAASTGERGSCQAQ